MTELGTDDFPILFEDNHVIVVVKPQNLASCPDESGDYNALDSVKAYLKKTYDKKGNVYTGLVHRLDRPTGGVMVFAKTSKAASRLSEQMRTGDFSDIEMVLTMRDQLFETIADKIKTELTRINEARSNTKASMLYLTILNETKNMVLQSRNLLKSQQYFLLHRPGAPKTWIKQ